MTQAPKHGSRWLSLGSVPQPPLVTTRFVTEPLDDKHAALDFTALMSCRSRLRDELQWGSWPPEDFTLESNRADLSRHNDEFKRGEAFAYTVLSPKRTRCLGCIYIERCVEIDGAQLAYWVIDEAIDMEEFLVANVLEWMHKDWCFRRVLVPLRKANSRGLVIAREYGLVESGAFREGPLSDHHCFLSQMA